MAYNMGKEMCQKIGIRGNDLNNYKDNISYDFKSVCKSPNHSSNQNLKK